MTIFSKYLNDEACGPKYYHSVKSNCICVSEYFEQKKKYNVINEIKHF